MKDIRKRPHRPSPSLVPIELVGKNATCPNCGVTTEIPWLEKMEYPKQPIKSDFGAAHWVPVDFPINCSADQCNSEFFIPVPKLPNESRWSLYGDEAARFIPRSSSEHSSDDLNFYCITLVGLHKRKHERVQRQISKIKQNIRPNVDPESWAHHFTEIWDSKPDSGVFSLTSKEAKIEHAKKFAKIIREAMPDLVVFNFSECIRLSSEPNERKKAIKEQKERMFSESILQTLWEFRSHGKCVNWIFDNIQDVTSGKKVEGWAAERFLGLQYTRLFCWMSAGATVLEPTFVRPGSHYLLEVADFISYCVARDFYRAFVGKPCEFPSSLLGKCFYTGAMGNGDVMSMPNIGLPIKEFYGLSITKK